MVVAALDVACRDAAPSVRESAALALGELKVPAAVPVLTGHLADPDDSVRCAVLTSLASTGVSGRLDLVQSFVACLCEANDEVRNGAADCLASVGPGAIPALTGLLGHTQRPERTGAVRALSSFKTLPQDVASPLLSAAQDRTFDDREFAVMALGHVPAAVTVDSSLIAILEDDPQDGARSAAATALGLHGAVRALMTRLHDEPDLAIVVSCIGRSLAHLHHADEALDVLWTRAAHARPDLKPYVALDIAGMGAAVVPALVRRLVVSNDGIEASNLLWLLLQGSEETSPVAPAALAPAIPGLTDLALSDSPPARKSAANCLSMLAKRCTEDHVHSLDVILRSAHTRLAQDKRPEPQQAATAIAQNLQAH
jgi:hypothetical protein